uniref:RING-type domain-containing protein n=1 Tax=Amblyomma maculatum TaxID=34609 RepID=G3MTM0_AMBMU
MPPGSMQYTLVGFSKELDWRPLQFVKPLPPNRVCSACGLVRPKTVFLPCSHTLCLSCYDQCTEENLHACPLDGYECHDEDVISVDFTADELFKREVTWYAERKGSLSCLDDIAR